MALIAHYPLLTDAKDAVGVNDGVASGPYTVTGGKLGGSTVFTLASDKITIPHNNLLSSKIFGRCNIASISVWVYPTAWTDTGVIISKATDINMSNCTFALWQRASGFVLILGANRSDNVAGSYTSITSKPVLNAWYHLVGILDGTNMKFYVNNVLIGTVPIANVTSARTENTAPITIGPRTSTSADSAVRGNIADLKIYDHALSLKEIADLYKAKVVHYKFNTFQEPVQNRVTWDAWVSNVAIGSSATNGNIKVTRLDTYKYKFEYLADITGVTECLLGTLGQDSTVGYNHTISAKIIDYSLASDSTGDFGISRNSLDHSYPASNVLNGVGSLWTKSVTFPMNPANFNINYNDQFMLVNENVTIKAGSYIIIEELQSERSAYATPFVDGFNSARVVDISGYDRDIINSSENSLTSNRFPKWVNTPSMIGSGAYDFGIAPCQLSIPYGNGIDPSVLPLTISMMVQTPSTAGDQIFFSALYATGQKLYIAKTIGKWDFGIQNTDWSGTGTVAVIANKPTHIALVLDGANAKLYVDEVLAMTKPYTSFLIPSSFYLGFLYGSTYFWDGLIDDVRIYSSVFSASDIVDLRRQRGSLDENGNLRIEGYGSSIGFIHRFADNPMAYLNTTIQHVRNEIVQLTTTSNDPQMDISSTASPDLTERISLLDTRIYKYFQFKYRVLSGGPGVAEVFFTNARKKVYDVDQLSGNIPLNGDGAWHIGSIDMSLNPYWAHSPITGLRFDYTNTSGVTIEIEYVRLCSDEKQVSISEKGIITSKGLLTSGPTDGITYWWPLDGLINEVANDNLATPSASTGAIPTTFVNKLGYKTDGISGVITAPVLSDVNIPLGSLSFWVYIDPAQSWSNMFHILSAFVTDTNTSTYRWLKLALLDATTLRLTYATDPTTQYNIDIPNAPSLLQSKFAHVAILYSDSNNEGILQIYINGVSIGSIPITTSMVFNFVSGTLYLMADNNQFFTAGKISDVRVYNKLLSSQEINVLYERGNTSKNKMKFLDTGELYIKGNFKEV
jgi:hypothetical protein